MSKKVIAIGAYCPDDKRKKILKDLILDLKENKPELHILIYSRTFLPQDITSLVNKVVINNENPLIFDYEYKSILWYRVGDQRIGSSFYNPRDNTHIASLFNFTDSLKCCQALDYSIGFYIEYDVIIKDYSIFDETIDQLNTNSDIVSVVNGEGYNYPFFGVNLLKELISPTEQEELIKIKKSKSSQRTTSEQLSYDSLKQFYADRYSTVKLENKLECIVDSTPLYNCLWNWFIVDLSNKDNIIISIYNPSPKTLANNVIFKINDQIVHTNNEVCPIGNFKLINTDINLTEVNTLEIIEGKKSKKINLESPEEKSKFRVHNYKKLNNENV